MDYKQEINEAGQGFNDEAVYMLEQGSNLGQIEDEIFDMVSQESKRLSDIVFDTDSGFNDFLRGSDNIIDKHQLENITNEVEYSNPQNAYKFMKVMITEIIRLDLIYATFPLDIQN